MGRRDRACRNSEAVGSLLLRDARRVVDFARPPRHARCFKMRRRERDAAYVSAFTFRATRDSYSRCGGIHRWRLAVTPLSKRLLERANALVLALLWSALAVCVIDAW